VHRVALNVTRRKNLDIGRDSFYTSGQGEIAMPGPQPNYQELPSAGAQELAEALIARRWSQAAGAKTLGCSPGFLNHLLHGRKLPGRTLALKIQDTLGVRVESWDEKCPTQISP
jgi:hypothetical protein